MMTFVLAAAVLLGALCLAAILDEPRSTISRHTCNSQRSTSFPSFIS
jgi:hypothetical protein